MRKWIIGLVLAAFCLSLCACGETPSPQSTTAPITTEAPTQPPADPTDPTNPPPAEGARVRVMNSDAKCQQAWEQLADEYEQATGIDVQIVFSFEHATLRNIYAQEQLPDNCADLSASAACAQLMSQDLVLKNDQGQIFAVANDIEVYGLVYNSTLLAQTAHTRNDIRSFADLTDVVYSISDNAKTYGFSAFTPVDANNHFAIQLAMRSGNSRNLVDLILNNTAADPSAVNSLWDFVDGKAVFYLAGTRDQDVLSIIGSENMDVLPIYMGGENEENQTLCVAARSYWCVNGDADPADVAATLDFLDFLTTPRADGTLPVDALNKMTPFRQASYVSNIPEQVLRMDVAQGRIPVVCPYVAQVPAGLTDALNTYAQNPSDENWETLQQIISQP